jgi:hypothetical protein
MRGISAIEIGSTSPCRRREDVRQVKTGQKRSKAVKTGVE